MRTQITLGNLLSAVVEAERNAQYHLMPGVVSAYHPGSASSPAAVDVQPAVNDVRIVSATGVRFSEPWPVIPQVPILFLSCGPYLVAAPMSAGDKVVLLGFDLDPTAHQQTGQTADPPDVTRHAGAYWCAIPGDITTPGAFADGPAIANGLTLGAKGSAAQIRFTTSTISLGANPTDFVALASLVQGELTKIATAFTSFVPGTGGASFTAPYTSPGNVASSLIKAQ